jgi:hypothetical protein
MVAAGDSMNCRVLIKVVLVVVGVLAVGVAGGMVARHHSSTNALFLGFTQCDHSNRFGLK